jgi:hypothetical protein
MTAQGRTQTIAVQGGEFAYLSAYTSDATFAAGVSTNGSVFAGSITAHDCELRRNNVAIIKLTSDGATLPAQTASRVAVIGANKEVESSAVTTTELDALTGIEGNVQAQLGAEASSRLAADLALLASQPTIRAITYKGGLSAFAASAARVGWLDYGGAVMLRVCAFGAGTLADMAPLVVAIYDSDGTAARVQVSLTLDTGTLVMQTTARALPLSAWRRLGVRVDAPSGGALSSASVAVHIEGETYTLANGGLEVVGTAYSGAPAAGTGAWTLCATSDGSNALSARVASEGWQALNYPLSADDYALWFATGKLPHAGAGTMQLLANGSFETFTGTADDGVTDTFAGWTNTTGASGTIEAVTDAGVTGKACKITLGVVEAVYLRAPLPPGPYRCTVSIRTRGDGSVAGRWGVYSATRGVNLPDTSGATLASTGVTGTNWTTVVRTWDIAREDGICRLSLHGPGSLGLAYFAEACAYVAGDTLAGLDLSAQPVCSRAASGAVLLDAASGVEVWPATMPERMTLATQLPMTANGYLLADQVVHPAGYIVDKVLVANTGSASATVTLRAGSSGGAAMATGTVAATGLPVALPLSSLSALTATGGKIHVAGGTASSPLAVTVILQRA